MYYFSMRFFEEDAEEADADIKYVYMKMKSETAVIKLPFFEQYEQVAKRIANIL